MVADSCFWCDDVDGLGRGPLTRPWSPDLDGRWSSHGSWSSTIRLEIFQLKIEQERLRLVSRSNRRAEYPNTVGIWIPTIWIPNFLKFGFQTVSSCALFFVLDQPFKYQTSKYENKMASICSTSKLLLTIGMCSSSYCKLSSVQTWNSNDSEPDFSGFQIRTVSVLASCNSKKVNQ